MATMAGNTLKVVVKVEKNSCVLPSSPSPLYLPEPDIDPELCLSAAGIMAAVEPLVPVAVSRSLGGRGGGWI